jgi:glycine/D-amino acid oxidase-like deaminating enzyme
MTHSTADIVICGAGMAGAAAAYHLAVRNGLTDIVLVDERPPLTLTSDKGTEAYRNWFPGPGETMVRLMNRSIDLLEELAEESNNYFQLNRRGYAFFTANPDLIPQWQEQATALSALGAGPVRQHPGPLPYAPTQAEGFDRSLSGADLVTDPALIRREFPFLTQSVAAMLHVRRCGWMSNTRLGGWLLERAQRSGVRVVRDKVVGVTVAGGRVESVQLGSGNSISAGAFVIAAGPYLKNVAALLGLDIPVVNELHAKVRFKDVRGLLRPDLPFMIWNDPVRLPWSDDERGKWASDPQTRWLLEEFPAGVHFRPRGDELLALWTYDVQTQAPVWPPRFEPHYAEVVLRGLSAMVPGLSVYFGQGQAAIVDGGYYCKTRENRPLIGPLPVRGAYVIGALSGYGVMASQAAAELLAAHLTGRPLPDYAPMFLLERYADPKYQALLAQWDARSGQL